MQDVVLFNSVEEYNDFISDNSEDLKDTVFYFDLSVDDADKYHFKGPTGKSRFNNSCYWVFNLRGSMQRWNFFNITIENFIFTHNFTLKITAEDIDLFGYDARFTFQDCAFSGDNLTIESHNEEIITFKDCYIGEDAYCKVAIHHTGDSRINIPENSHTYVSCLVQTGPGSVNLNGRTTKVSECFKKLQYVYELLTYKRKYRSAIKNERIKKIEYLYKRATDHGSDYALDELIEETVNSFLERLPESEHEKLSNFTSSVYVEIPYIWSKDEFDEVTPWEL